LTEVADYIDDIKKFKVIDVHMHLGVTSNVYYYNYNDEKVINLQKKFNVKKSLCSHCVGFSSLDNQMDEIYKLVDKFGDFICWYLIYDPHYPQKSLDIIDKNKDKINFAGIKIHPVFHETRLDDKAYYPLWEYVIQNDIVVLSHTWSPYTESPKQFLSNPLLVENVLTKFEELKFIVGHGGGKIPFYSEVIELLKRHNNLYVEFAGDTLYPKIFRRVIDEVGSKRVLFGTDMPMIDIRYHLISVFKADLTNEERGNIFYNNAVQLFKFDK